MWGFNLNPLDNFDSFPIHKSSRRFGEPAQEARSTNIMENFTSGRDECTSLTFGLWTTVSLGDVMERHHKHYVLPEMFWGCNVALGPGSTWLKCHSESRHWDVRTESLTALLGWKPFLSNAIFDLAWGCGFESCYRQRERAKYHSGIRHSEDPRLR